jgi:hypothetical protein
MEFAGDGCRGDFSCSQFIFIKKFDDIQDHFLNAIVIPPEHVFIECNFASQAQT